jgi:hypothetical protein
VIYGATEDKRGIESITEKERNRGKLTEEEEREKEIDTI